MAQHSGTCGLAPVAGALVLALLAVGCGRSHTLPDGTVGVPYRAELSGPDAPLPGTPPFALAAGELPPGLALAGGAAIAGTPTEAGRFTFTLRGRDATGELQIVVQAGRVAARPAHWVGRYDYRLSQHVPSGDQIATAHVDIQLDEDGQGALTGTAEGTVTADLTLSTCPSHTITPGRLHAKLEGTRTPTAMKLTLASQQWEEVQISPCPNGRLPGVIGGGRIYGIEDVLPALSSDDGTHYAHHEESTRSSGAYPYTIRHDLSVEPAP